MLTLEAVWESVFIDVFKKWIAIRYAYICHALLNSDPRVMIILSAPAT